MQKSQPKEAKWLRFLLTVSSAAANCGHLRPCNTIFPPNRPTQFRMWYTVTGDERRKIIGDIPKPVGGNRGGVKEELKQKRRAQTLRFVLRAEGKNSEEILEKTGYHISTASKLIVRYMRDGLSGTTENHYKGKRRNMSFEEEAAIPAPFI